MTDTGSGSFRETRRVGEVRRYQGEGYGMWVI